MNKIFTTVTVSRSMSFLLAGCLLASPPTDAMFRVSPQSSIAKVTDVHGLVVIQIPLSVSDPKLSAPSAARKGDRLPHGSHLRTGSKSWAQITWPDIVARAWSNAVFSIAPNRKLAYVSNGEVLFRLKKNRKDKDEFMVITKFVQARVHGTTILVQSDDRSTRVTVLEGNIAAVNRIDRSVIDIKPGLVYEVRNMIAKAVAPHDDLKLNGLDLGTSAGAPDQSLGIVADKIKPAHVFVGQGEQTNLYAVDPKSLLHHPLVEGFSDNLDSMPLIKDAMSQLPAEVQNPSADAGKSSEEFPPELLHAAHVDTAPEVGTYKIGHDIDELIPHDQDTYTEHPPAGELAPNQEPFSEVTPDVVPTADSATPSPTADNATASPITDIAAPLPTANNGTPAQTGDNPTPAPITDNVAPLPAVDNPTPSPTADNATPAPITDSVAPQPTANNGTPAQTGDNPTPAPITDNVAPLPTVDNRTPSPTADNATPSPMADNGGPSQSANGAETTDTNSPTMSEIAEPAMPEQSSEPPPPTPPATSEVDQAMPPEVVAPQMPPAEDPAGE